MLSTLNKSSGLTPSQKKEKINQHRLFHHSLLEEYQVPENDFNVKLVFYDKGTKVIGVFPNEFLKPNGFYLEFVDKNLDPTDPQRKLWRLPARENYESTYNILSSGAYAVPIDELEEVPVRKAPVQEFKVDLSDGYAKQDDHYSKLTIRDLAAILWQKPVSEKKWLNELVNQANQEQV